jgi:hypothetical protein
MEPINTRFRRVTPPVNCKGSNSLGNFEFVELEGEAVAVAAELLRRNIAANVAFLEVREVEIIFKILPLCRIISVTDLTKTN